MFVPAGERALAGVGLSPGILSAAEGGYQRAQLLLDITQGARVQSAAYPTPRPPLQAPRPLGAGAVVPGWGAVLAPAARAPERLQPGLLAGSVPGGAGYAGTGGGGALDAVAAAGRGGRIAVLSLGSTASLPRRIAALSARLALVVADLPGGREGLAQLARLRAGAPRGRLLIVVQRAPAAPGAQLLWAGLGADTARRGELTSRTTRQRGLVASIDIAPTVLGWLGIRRPAALRGAALEVRAPLDGSRLRGLIARLRAIGGRRLPALAALLGAWLVLVLACSPWPRARRRALRAGAVGLLWAPLASLLPAALEPSAGAEYAIIAGACLSLGALTDLLVAWPRAPLVPALATPLVLTVDALAGTQLLMRSLLGPDPALGARFYGFGNELKSGLAVLVLGGLAAALYPARRGRRAVTAAAAAGAALAVIEGSALIGAAAGGVVLVCAAFAVAAATLAPGARDRRVALLVELSPLAGLAALAALDLALAHGGGHYTGSILHARSAGDVRDLLVGRWEAAWRELGNHQMPFATAAAVACAALWLARRRRVLQAVHGDPGWNAALYGALTAGVVGALVEDSGPVLLVVAVFTLGCLLAYVRFPAQGPRAGSPRRREQAPAPLAAAAPGP